MWPFDYFKKKKEKEERARLEQERLEQERLERERLERERLERERLERERLDEEFEDKESNKAIIEDKRTAFYKIEEIKYRPMGGDFMLAPYDWQAFFTLPDASLLSRLANTERIKRFLPGLGFEDEESTKERLEACLRKTELQLGVTYVIRCSNFPVGMIIVNTPLYNKTAINLAIWTLDFFICEALEHKGIMYNSILRVLNDMKLIMGVRNVYALVDRDNEDCIRLLGRGLFRLIDSTGFTNKDKSEESPLVYMIDLSTIRFEKRR